MENETTRKSLIIVIDYLSTMNRAYKESSKMADVAEKEKRKNMKEKMSEEDIENRYEDAMQSTMNVPVERRLLWQEQSIPHIGGLTPVQYIDSIESIQDLVELVSFFMAEDMVLLPVYLQEKIKKIESKHLPYLHEALSCIRPTEDPDVKALNMAVLYIIQTLGLPEFFPGLVKILEHIPYSQDDRLYYRVSSQLMLIGEPVLDLLMQTYENLKSEDMKQRVRIPIVEIMKENKSDRYFKWLKEKFRKTEGVDKILLARDLVMYGDSRAVTAIKGYVERDKENISNAWYRHYRGYIIALGGSVDDLDEYFDVDFDEED